MSIEDKIAACMAKVRKAVAAAPSHEELFAGIEAMLRHMSGADDEEADIPAAANDTEQPQIADQSAGDLT